MNYKWDKGSARGLDAAAMYVCDTPSTGDVFITTRWILWETDIFGCRNVAAVRRQLLSTVWAVIIRADLACQVQDLWPWCLSWRYPVVIRRSIHVVYCSPPLLPLFIRSWRNIRSWRILDWCCIPAPRLPILFGPIRLLAIPTAYRLLAVRFRRDARFQFWLLTNVGAVGSAFQRRRTLWIDSQDLTGRSWR